METIQGIFGTLLGGARQGINVAVAIKAAESKARLYAATGVSGAMAGGAIASSSASASIIGLTAGTGFLGAVFAKPLKELGEIFGTFDDLKHFADTSVGDVVDADKYQRWHAALSVILQLLCLLPFTCYHLLISLIENFMMLLVLFIITFILLVMQTYSASIIDFTDHVLHLSTSAINLGGQGFNILADGTDALQPLTNVQISYSMRSSYQIINALSVNGAQRRLQSSTLFDTSQVIDNITPQIQVLTAVNGLYNGLLLLFQDLFLTYVYPLVVDLLTPIEIVMVRFGCIASAFICAIRQIFQDIISPFVSLLGSSFSVACGEGDFDPKYTPCICHGNGFFSFQDLGLFTGVGACRRARVLCELEDSACEYIDGRLIGCHHDALLACPLSRRALSPIGHALNFEDTKDYEVCLNGTALFHAATHAEWTYLGTCDDRGRDLQISPANPQRVARDMLLHAFGKAPVIVSMEERRRITQERERTREEAANEIKRATKGSLFDIPGFVHCDLTSVGKTPYEQFVDMACIGRAIFAPSEAPRGRRMDALFDIAHLIRSRRMLIEGLDSTNWHVAFQSSELTDRIPMFKSIRRLAMAVEAGASIPNRWVKYEAAHKEREQQRRALFTTGTCAAGLQVCPDRSCVAPGTPCPEGCPDWFGPPMCALNSAESTIAGFNPAALYQSTETCWSQYDATPEIDPTGPAATTHPETIVYCWPMKKELGWRIPMVSFSLQQYIQAACQTGLTLACECPQYLLGDFDYDGRWFGIVTKSEEDRLQNGLIALQWVVGVAIQSSIVTSWINLGWAGFWSAFKAPSWLTWAFGTMYPGLGWSSQLLCFVLHMGDMAYCVFFIFSVWILVKALWPFGLKIVQLVETCLPGRWKSKKKKKDKKRKKARKHSSSESTSDEESKG
jgi:hypothetical protein